MTDTQQERNSPFIDKFRQLERQTSRNQPFVIAATRITYGELFDSVSRLAAFFDQLNLDLGDRVLVTSADDAATSVIFLSLLRCGITAVIVDPFLSERQITLIIETVDPKAVFVDGTLIRTHSQQFDLNVPLIEITRDHDFDASTKDETTVADYIFPAVLEHLVPSTALPHRISPSLVAYILFTSGTTSRPKGVEITHFALFEHMVTMTEQFGLDDNARILNLFPLHHTDGLTQGMILALISGGCLIRPFRFAINRLPALFDCIFNYRITHFVATPTLLSLMLTYCEGCTNSFGTTDFQFVISSAAALNETLWREFEATFGVMVVNVYGLTETTNIALYCGPDDRTRRIGTVGKPIKIQTKVIDEWGNSVSPGTVGELILRGPILMAGYFRQPDETVKVLKDGWYHTGDLARYDTDGFISIVGRQKNLIVRGGLNINPEEVTELLLELPQVLEAETIGIEDEIFGERVVSCVVRHPDFPITKAQILDQLLQRASSELAPNDIHFMVALPRGPSGKVIIEALRAAIVCESHGIGNFVKSNDDEPATSGAY